MQRHYGMDWLRIGAFGILIFYHIGMVFVPWNYHIKTLHPMDWVAIPMQAANAWRLDLLFLVSGYASRAILQRRPQPGRFAWERTLRLVIPLLVGIIVIVPPQPWVELGARYGYHPSYLHFWWHDYFQFRAIGKVVLPTWNHLWFVGYLWTYTLGLALLAAIIPAGAATRLARIADRAFGGILILLVPIGLLWIQAWWTFPGAPETHAFIDDWPIHRVYIGMFLFGVYLRGSSVAWDGIRRWWKLALALAIIAYAYVVAVELIYPGALVPPRWMWGLFVAARGVQSWGAIIALIGIADRWWNHDHRWRTTLNEAIFPFYIIHQTIIVVVGGALRDLGIGALAEFVILLAATVAGCWLFYLIGREINWARPLIGLKLRPARPAAAA